METFIKHIGGILKSDDRLWSKDEDKKLLKNKLVELVGKDDEKLLKALLSDAKAKKQFFKKIGESTIFLKDDFIQFVTMNEFLPDSFTAFENKIGLTDNGKLLSSKDDVSLVFPYKDCILEGGQEKTDEKRDEIFYNTVLAPDEVDRLKEPKAFTNWKKYDKDGEHEVKNVSEDDNFIIKGNNLLALYSLLPKYRGKVKLIYIDPPYNTGNDEFKYNDKFNHSSWLVFIKNRLQVANELLSENGSIWINIDDNESHYLKVLCDEIFNRDNFVGNVIWEKSDSPRMDAKFFSNRHDHIIVYSKNIDCLRFNLELDKKIPKHYNKKDNKGRLYYLKPLRVMGGNISESLYFPMISPDGTEIYPVDKNEERSCWRWSKKKIENESYRIEWVNGKNGWAPYFKIYADSRVGTPIQTIWKHEDVGSNRTSKNELKKIINADIFDTPKPEKLLQRILHIGSNENDIALDFFAGSGTTGAVAHKMNRKYILVEQMDYIHDLPEARLKKVVEGEKGGISKEVGWKGGGSFIYAELLEWNKKYIDELEKSKTKADIKKVYKKIKKEAFYKYQVETDKFSEKDLFALSENEQKKVLMDMLDMNHLYVNIDSIDDATFKVSKEDKELNKKFYHSSIEK